MNRNEAEARMQEVQRIMERTTLYTLMPGQPAIVGGILALLGCVASYAMIRSFDFQAVLDLPLARQYGFCAMWAAVGVVAVGQEIIWTTRAARREPSVMGRPARITILSLTPCVVIAIVITIKLLLDTQMRYVVPVWMMCYGAGVYAAGLFSLRLPRLLGIAFIVMGAVGLLAFPDCALILAALSFGLLHIAFGLIVLARSRQDGDQ